MLFWVTNVFTSLFIFYQTREGDQVIERAIDNPQDFIMKLQRNCGDGNVFGDDVKRLLMKIKDTDERHAYILSQKIETSAVTNYPVRAGQPIKPTQMITEIGSYGAILGTPDKVILSKAAGYLAKSKKEGAHGGSLSTGIHVIDSPMLV